MYRNRMSLVLALCGLVLMGIIAFTVWGAPANQADNIMETLEFEVSVNMASFMMLDQPTFEDGLPSHGNPFIVEGYIYPAGTLDGSNGVLENGDPEFPDQVIGRWICSGWFYGDAMHASTGAYAVTTQLFELGSQLGETSITSYGYEIADAEIPLQRAIMGGTGQYAGVNGQQIQTYLGDNASGAPVLNMQFTVAETR